MVGLTLLPFSPSLSSLLMCSPSWKWELEFYSVKVANGTFTSYLH
ncbi:MAG: hypothetical protein ACKERG_04400 [Candidatus Hodgkinia cicadicola]